MGGQPDRLWHTGCRSEGKRCDLVLTPDGLPLRDPELDGTLFAEQDAVDPAGAYWLEIKTVAQYEIGGPFKRYSAELLAADVLSRDVDCQRLVRIETMGRPAASAA